MSSSKPCSFSDCPHPFYAKGLCTGHYQQHRKQKPLVPLCERPETCSAASCTLPHYSLGYCRKHYKRLSRHGDVDRGRTLSEITERGEYLEVAVHGVRGVGKICLLDNGDRHIVEKKSLSLDTGGYAGFAEGDKRTLLHRRIMGLQVGDEVEVDHENGNRLDNRRPNLRLVNRFEQMQNKKPWGKSGHRNVYWEDKKKLWRVSVKKNFVLHTAGLYEKIEDAITAARTLREKLFSHHVEDRCSTPVAGPSEMPG